MLQTRETGRKMPRPNHDLPNLLLGGVKDYADEQGISNEEAHAELLRIGLVEQGVLSRDLVTPDPGTDGNGDGR